jgi:hypothetical protein
MHQADCLCNYDVTPKVMGGASKTKFAQDVTLTTPACTHSMPRIIVRYRSESCN